MAFDYTGSVDSLTDYVRNIRESLTRELTKVARFGRIQGIKPFTRSRSGLSAGLAQSTRLNQQQSSVNLLSNVNIVLQNSRLGDKTKHQRIQAHVQRAQRSLIPNHPDFGQQTRVIERLQYRLDNPPISQEQDDASTTASTAQPQAASSSNPSTSSSSSDASSSGPSTENDSDNQQPDQQANTGERQDHDQILNSNIIALDSEEFDNIETVGQLRGAIYTRPDSTFMRVTETALTLWWNDMTDAFDSDHTEDDVDVSGVFNMDTVGSKYLTMTYANLLQYIEEYDLDIDNVYIDNVVVHVRLRNARQYHAAEEAEDRRPYREDSTRRDVEEDDEDIEYDDEDRNDDDVSFAGGAGSSLHLANVDYIDNDVWMPTFGHCFEKCIRMHGFTKKLSIDEDDTTAYINKGAIEKICQHNDINVVFVYKNGVHKVIQFDSFVKTIFLLAVKMRSFPHKKGSLYHVCLPLFDISKNGKRLLQCFKNMDSAVSGFESVVYFKPKLESLFDFDFDTTIEYHKCRRVFYLSDYNSSKMIMAYKVEEDNFVDYGILDIYQVGEDTRFLVSFPTSNIDFLFPIKSETCVYVFNFPRAKPTSIANYEEISKKKVRDVTSKAADFYFYGREHASSSSWKPHYFPFVSFKAS